MDHSNSLNPTAWLTVGQMMNKNFQVLHLGDTLRTVVEYYQKYKINTLPVVDENEKLIGVFPKKRLFKALLEGAGLDAPCKTYMVDNPVFITVDRTYDEYSLVVRVTKSRVDNVVVLDSSNKVVGMIGTAEYLRESLNVIMASSALLESLFRVNNEGIIIIDREGYILRINPAAERMFQLNFTEVKGKPLKEVLPEIMISDELHIGLKRTVKSLPVIINQVPIIENDEQIGSSFAFLDISDMEKIAQELEIVKELQTTIDGVLSASSDGVFVSDISGAIKYVNERACQLVSQTPEQIIGNPIQSILQTNSPIKITKSGSAEVDSCDIYGKKCIVSHIPFKKSTKQDAEITGIVSTVYLNDNVVTEEIARKWFYLNQQVQYYRDELEKRNGNCNRFDQIVTNNSEFKKIKKEAQFIARSSSTVLLTGESGVGKDMFARGIHEASPRAKRPFVKVNCVSIPETLFESELFGYAPGSFTGALKNGKPGYFERAHLGTIFLDEIGDMPLSIQAKLLQVLQEKEFMRVGGTTKQTVDVRIIAATNRDLREAIVKKTFREDLFYRLNVIEFHLPPLRERAEDITALAESFIEKYNHILGSRVTGINEQARKALQDYSWPGNIRELENAIERAANYVWEGEIGIENLPGQIIQLEHKPTVASAYRSSLVDFEKEMLLDVLKKTNGNRSAAARMLNLSRSAFYDRLAKYNLK
ncbi:sigma-54-dependent Fis family transcriptional regulator [Sinanaerobacter chloroacetimidivorans]|uniref:Sigma 54-interacting transcriptional regulator n=1 Tax=Sinanaerobacter chloroacetimidivorans TaxID=2818044 RepID=A0A8J8B078_9FIRM|nr:sigma-54-dependent Fis family transcriptional regulator [Sinanaerobacter chloroacetimidivorans]MBR0596919.1 sigma 54-interacting transcriptional regulator [Sinanaerobacter chloroacetimidivorans]